MKRTKFLTYKDVQVRLATMFLIWFFVFAAASIAFYFYTYSQTAERIESLKLADEFKTKAVVIDQSERLALGYIFITFLYIFLVFIFTLVYSNRLTGPIFKLKRVLEAAIEKKSWPDEIRFRKHDAFRDLADKFNEFVRTMRVK